MGGLSRRIEALAAAHVERAYRAEAERLAHQDGGSAAVHFAELWSIGTAVARRFGPHPDLYEVVRWLAEERGVDPAEAEAALAELREGR